MSSCFGETGSSGEPSPKSHQPSLPPEERLWKLTVRLLLSTAKLATGLAGLMILSSNGEAYIMIAPESRPASVPRTVLSQLPFSAPSFDSDSFSLIGLGPP